MDGEGAVGWEGVHVAIDLCECVRVFVRVYQRYEEEPLRVREGNPRDGNRFSRYHPERRCRINRGIFPLGLSTRPRLGS